MWLPTPISYSTCIENYKNNHDENNQNIVNKEIYKNKIDKMVSFSKSYDNNYIDENQIICDQIFDIKLSQNLNKRLIGDLSRHCILPVIEGKHNDLLTLTSSILSEIVNLYYNPKTNMIEYQNYNIYIIDCRYPYEFEGGHIYGAINIHRSEDISKHFIDNVSMQLFNKNGKIPILIFHCEFSSKRGPRL